MEFYVSWLAVDSGFCHLFGPVLLTKSYVREWTVLLRLTQSKKKNVSKDFVTQWIPNELFIKAGFFFLVTDI